MADTSATLLLRTEPIGKLLLRYSLPAIAAMVVFSLYNIIDSIFIGHGVGPLAISGLAITFPVMNLTFALVLLVGIGGASICSIRLGQQDIDGATRVLGNVLLLGLINGVTFGLLSQLVLDPVLTAFGASEHTLPYARDFMQVLLLGNPVSFLFIGLNNVMRATGYPKKAMLSSLLTVGVNIILAPIFIFHLDWGIRGAATATILAQMGGLAWVLNHFLHSSSYIHFRRGFYRLRKHVIMSIFSIGMAPFLLNVCASGIVIVLNHNFKIYGGDLAIGAYGIVNRVATLFVMVVIGLTQGMQPVVGYNFGARHFERVQKTLKKVIRIAVTIMGLGWVCSELLPGHIVAMFSDDAELNKLAEVGLRITILSFPMVGAQIVITNFFQSIGKAKISILLSLARQLLFLIPLLYTLPHMAGLDIYGVWGSMPLADTLAFIAAILTLRWYLKKTHGLQTIA